mmetsp:Transcript_29468/g.40476  ORF Transcript_29468/g.40476 Transcript_29468/m.40476 type:complete len:88 (-) Transcript_29468:326-589(-)
MNIARKEPMNAVQEASNRYLVMNHSWIDGIEWNKFKQVDNPQPEKEFLESRSGLELTHLFFNSGLLFIHSFIHLKALDIKRLLFFNY